MQVASLPRQRRTRPIVLSGALCVAAVLTGCGGDEGQRRLSPQVTAANGVYRTANGGSSGSSGSTAWSTTRRGGADDSSASERDGSSSRNGGAGSESDSHRTSQRGGFGSSGHGFFHFGG